MSGTPKVYTARDLNRSPAKVFEAVRKFGSVEIRTRNGDTFEVREKKSPAERKSPPDFDAHWNRLREDGYVPPPSSELDRIDKIIAGEE